MKIKNVIIHGKISDPSYFDKMMSLLSADESKRNENYTYENMDFKNHLTYDLLLTDDDEIICFSGLYSRPGWGERIYRSSNRTYVNPKFRNNAYNFYNPMYIVPHQVTKFQSHIDIVFSSREHYKSEFFFKKAKTVVDFYKDWVIMDNMIKVVPTSTKKSAYQKVIVKSFTGAKLPFASITKDEWNMLPD